MLVCWRMGRACACPKMYFALAGLGRNEQNRSHSIPAFMLGGTPLVVGCAMIIRSRSGTVCSIMLIVAMIYVDRVVHTLEELFGLDKSKVESIRADLEAGRPVHIEVQALRTQLIQAGFIPD